MSRQPEDSEVTESPSAPRDSGLRDRGGVADTVAKRVGRVDSVVCYEVTEDELARIEEGSPESLMLNLAVALLSAGATTLPVFFTATFNSDFAKYGFLFWTILAFLAGFILLGVWSAFRRSRTNIFGRIRKRGEVGEGEPVPEKKS